MKLNKYFMLGLAGLAFAACSNEDGAENALTQGNKKVTVTIKTSDYTQTKATGGWSTSGAITASNIKIYLLDGNDKIVAIETATGTGTFIYHEVDKSVQKIAAVANCIPTTGKDGQWNDLINETFDVDKFQTAATTPLFAGATDLDYKGADTDGYPLYTATLRLATMLSRIELSGNLQCEDLGDNAYSKLVLKYIGTNNVNTKFTLTGTGSAPHNITSMVTGFPDLTPDTGTPVAFYDEVNPNITLSDKAVQPLAQTYGYSVCGMPVVTLQFDSEERTDGVIPPYIVYDPAYLKIVSFKEERKEGEAETNTPVTFAPGYIYQITDLIFKEENVTTLDNSVICVEAVVAVTPWEIKGVDPVYGD